MILINIHHVMEVKRDHTAVMATRKRKIANWCIYKLTFALSLQCLLKLSMMLAHDVQRQVHIKTGKST